MSTEFDVPSGAAVGTVPEHTHSAGEINGLEAALAAKAAKNHTHAVSDVSGLAGEFAAIEETAANAMNTAEAAAGAVPEIRAGTNVSVVKNGNVVTISAAGTGGGSGETVPPALEAGNNITLTVNEITGATVISAAAGGEDMNYTVNGAAPDESGNFLVTAAGLGAAETGHGHTIAEINGLSGALAAKASSVHSHTFVTGITVGERTVSGEIVFEGGDNVSVTLSGNTLSLDFDAVAAEAAGALRNLIPAGDGEAPLKLFVGSAAEWEAFTPEAGTRYLVFIVENGA